MAISLWFLYGVLLIFQLFVFLISHVLREVRIITPKLKIDHAGLKVFVAAANPPKLVRHLCVIERLALYLCYYDVVLSVVKGCFCIRLCLVSFLSL